MFGRLKSVWNNHHPAIVVLGIVFCGHLGWKHLQDIGIGDRGRDYPFFGVIDICSNKIKEVLSSKKNEGEKKDE